VTPNTSRDLAMSRALVTFTTTALILCACSAKEPQPIHVAIVDTCHGGAVRPVCGSQKDMCVTPYPDAGKRCSDSSECAGDCLVDLTAHCDGAGKCTAPEVPASGTGAFGTCEVDNDPCGSRIEVINGVVQPPVHVD